MTVTKELDTLISQADPLVKHYIAALKSENLRMVKQVAKIAAEITTANSTIASMKRGETERMVCPEISDAELAAIAKPSVEPKE